MIRTTLLAAGAALGLMAAAPASAEDPFSVSTELCNKYDMQGLYCTTPYPEETALEYPTIGHWARDMNKPLEFFLALNHWSEDQVSLDTIIPLGARFAFSGKPI